MKAECRRIVPFELWCWRILLRVPWTAWTSNQLILKEISPEYSLEELMLKLKLQYFGHLMQRTDSLEKTLMLGKIEAGREWGQRGWDGWMVSPTWWTWIWTCSEDWLWRGKPGMLQSMGSQRVWHDWVTELNWGNNFKERSYPKWIKDLNVRPETIKLLEENIGKTLSDINHSRILYDPPPRILEIKAKINKWDLMKLKSFFTTKETISKVKRELSEWEKIIANKATDKGLISQAAPAAQFQKNKWPNQRMGQRTNRHFSKEDIQMAKKHMKRCSTSLIIREIQIKTSMRYHYTPVKMAAIQKSTSNKCWRGCGEKGTLLHCWWECKQVQPLWKTVWRFLKKLEIELLYDSAIPSGHTHRGNQIWKRHVHPNVHCSTVYHSQDMEAT